MSNYATTTNLEILMNDTTFDTKTTNLVERAITHAEDKYIKPCLAKRYDITGWTAGTVPPTILALSEEIAMSLSYKYMSRGSKESLARAKSIFDPAIQQLKNICEGNSDLFNSNGSIIADIPTGTYFAKSNTEDFPTIFNVDDPLNWGLSNDQNESIKNERLSGA